MALTTLSPLSANLTQPLTTNIFTTNFTTLPFLTLGSATTDLPFLIPDPSLFSTDPPSFLLDSFNSNNNTFTDYDYTFDNNGTVVDNSSSSNGTTDDHTTNMDQEEDNPFLENDYNFYDYNPYDPNSTLVQEPYDYSASENSSAKPDDVSKVFDGVNHHPPARPLPHSTLTDQNPWFLWTPPFVCFLALILISLPCIILKLRDDHREKQGKTGLYGSLGTDRITRRHVKGKSRAADLERQSASADFAFPKLSGNAFSGEEDTPAMECVLVHE